MNNSARMKYFIRVTNVALFNTLVKAAERMASEKSFSFSAERRGGYYELQTNNSALWQELYLYGQMLAQAGDENIEGGELSA